MERHLYSYEIKLLKRCSKYAAREQKMLAIGKKEVAEMCRQARFNCKHMNNLLHL